MVVADNLHSKLVGWSKIILPLAALGLLSVLFMFARDTGPPPEISFAEIEAMARDQRISAPRFSGVTEDGSVVAISAQSAKPVIGKPETFSIDRVVAHMDNPDGSSVDITATSGEVNGHANKARFYGLARMETSSGYQMETNALTAELDTGIITSDGLVEIHAPFGELTAGQVTLQITTDEVGQQVLFTRGVRLIYRPQDQR
jgi:lipopolysaccharide export system protein LptC